MPGFYLSETSPDPTYIPLSVSTPAVDMLSVVPGLSDAIGDDEQDSNALINSYINANPGLRDDCIWYFGPGVYYHKVDIYQLNLRNVAVIGDPGTIFQKQPGDFNTTREYSFFTTGSENVFISGIDWLGVTTSLTAYGFGVKEVVNGDSGIYFGSSNNTRVMRCRFYNFGDSAVRITTNPNSTNNQDSVNGFVLYNYFENCAQVTTTPNGAISGGVGKGGCSNFNVIGNTLVNLKGSIKVACRFPTSGALIRDNDIRCAPNVPESCGIEILSYTNVQALYNTITGAANWAIHVYTNTEPGLNKIEYGNYNIEGNQLIRNYRGIRLLNGAYIGDNLRATPRNIKFNKNRIDRITYNANSTPSTIVFTGGTWGSGECKDNVMTQIANGVYATVQTNITASGNTPS